MKRWVLVLAFLAACGEKGDPGATGPRGTDGMNGLSGANGTNGTNGTNGQDGHDGAPGPVDPTVPGAVSNLHLLASPLGPPSIELWWTPAAGSVALSSVKVYRSATSFDESTKADVSYATVAGDATHTTLQLEPESGVVYIGVAPVSFTGVESQVTTTAIDTRQRVCFLGANGGPAEVRCTADGVALTFAGQGDFALSPVGTSALTRSNDGATLGVVDFEAATPAVATVFTTASTLSQQTFSPDGTAIAFLSSMGESLACDTDLYVVASAPASTPLKLTSSGTGSCPVDGSVSSLAWSPAGDLISYLAWDTTNARQTLKTIGRAGGTPIDWTTVDADHPIASSIVASGFSPDGQRIVMQANDNALWLADIAAQTVSLAFAAQPLPVRWTWSPDSTRLAVSTSDTVHAPGITAYIVQLDGSSVVVLSIFDIKSIVGLSWSPDGEWLAMLDGDRVVIVSTTSFDVLFDSVDASAHYSGNVSGAANSYGWTADSRRFAYIVRDNGTGSPYNGVHIIDSASGAETKFQQDQSIFFTWSQDGSHGDFSDGVSLVRIFARTSGTQTVATGLSSLTSELQTRFGPQ